MLVGNVWLMILILYDVFVSVPCANVTKRNKFAGDCPDKFCEVIHGVVAPR